jgi:hypothetical protein
MTSGLRKAHRYIWLILIIVIPILIFFSIKNLDVFSSEPNVSVQFKASKETIVSSSENDLIKASLFTKESTNHIEVILKSPLKNPSSIVYTLTDDNSKGELIGQLSTVGIYSFKLKKAVKGVVIYDALKESLITKLAF